MGEIIEEVGGEYGATVRYKVHENGASVMFFAAEIIGRTVPSNAPNYSQDENCELLEKAERYVDGWVKWDGCSHVSLATRTPNFIFAESPSSTSWRLFWLRFTLAVAN
jgi:hypothetical protein